MQDFHNSGNPIYYYIKIMNYTTVILTKKTHYCLAGFPSLRQEGPDGALDKATADGTLAQRRGTLFADDQMAAGDEDDVHLLVHADFTCPLLLEAPELLLHRQVWKRG